ncbi:alpha/beta hydrolase [Oxalobacteraceae sp. CFBP 13730]|nr:alpha/beta hydrolase [Oxalobacteraceae sp. CFBP 13730]
MSEPRFKSVQCISPAGLHRVAYKEWGAADNSKVLVCVHGVTRVGDDFDHMARALCDTWRVVCPDIVGRGRSDRLRDPAGYQVSQYVADMVTLIARVTASTESEDVAWFGTSMGGLIGMSLAALEGSPISRLVINDIGPALGGEALQRIGEYIGQDVRFPSFAAGADYIKSVSATFGPHADAEWHKLASDVLRQDADGQWHRHYDLNLAQPFRSMTVERAAEEEAALWAAWDAITCPTLLVRGEQSDLLSRATAQQMTTRGPRARLVELPGVGHAPTFVHADQIALARAFLTGTGS